MHVSTLWTFGLAVNSNRLPLSAVEFGLSTTLAYNAVIEEEMENFGKAMKFVGEVRQKVSVRKSDHADFVTDGRS